MSKKREYSAAQKAASLKYDEKFDYVRVRLPKGTADQIRAIGVSCNAFVADATLEKLSRINDSMVGNQPEMRYTQ